MEGWRRHYERKQTANLSYAEAVAAKAIEPGAEPLVEALNAIPGSKTIASCQGHGEPGRWWRPARVDQCPYVLFQAPLDLTRRITSELRSRDASGKLHYYWTVTAYFYPPDWCELAWVLRLEDIRIPKAWNRSFIDDDFRTLAAMTHDISTETN